MLPHAARRVAGTHTQILFAMLLAFAGACGPAQDRGAVQERTGKAQGLSTAPLPEQNVEPASDAPSANSAPTSAAAEPAPPVAQPTPAGPPPVRPGAAVMQCFGICQRAVELKCPQAEGCLQLCTRVMRVAACEAELTAANACMLNYPVSQWQCSQKGMAATKASLCVREQELYGSCLRAQPKR